MHHNVYLVTYLCVSDVLWNRTLKSKILGLGFTLKNLTGKIFLSVYGQDAESSALVGAAFVQVPLFIFVWTYFNISLPLVGIDCIRMLTRVERGEKRKTSSSFDQNICISNENLIVPPWFTQYVCYTPTTLPLGYFQDSRNFRATYSHRNTPERNSWRKCLQKNESVKETITTLQTRFSPTAF